MTAAENKAVFVSYASQDAEAAKRICEALRAAGVEVWFDQSELVGGDAWDAKIRGQIKACALFIPVISANTQARREGYFRLEWRLAVERMQQMDDDLPFLLPVVIDATRDADAFVPDRFRTVQWTRLPGGETTPAFGERVKKLLGGGDTVGAALRRDAVEPSRREAAPTRRPARSWLLPAVFALAAFVALAIWRPWKEAARTTLLDPTEATRAREKSTAPMSEAQRLVAKAWEQLNTPGLYRGELEIADDFCRRATTLGPDDPDTWATWSQVDTWYVYAGLDVSPERKESARTKAARALTLAPKSFEARLAEACYQVRGLGGAGSGSEASAFSAAAEKTLRQLLAERPNEPRVCFALGILLRNANRLDEGAEAFDLMALTPAFAATATSEKGWLLWVRGNYAAAQAACERSLVLQPFSNNLQLQYYLALSWTGDLEVAKAAVERLPPALLQEDKFASYAARIYWWRREPDQMLRVLDAVPRPWLTWMNGPRNYLVGQAHHMAGRVQAARISWTDALRQVDLQLEKAPQMAFLHWWKAELLGLLGRQNEARAAFLVARGLNTRGGDSPFRFVGDWAAALAIGDHAGAISSLEKSFENPTWVTTRAMLRLNPLFDPLRGDLRFQALLSRAEADPQRNPQGMRPPASTEAAAAPPTPSGKSIAVLAFRQLSADPENEYLCEAISDELCSVLGRVPGLKVAASASAFTFKGKRVRPSEMAAQLGVAYLVDGRVQKIGSRVRVGAELIKAADESVVWKSDTLEHEAKDLFAVQDQVVAAIARNLQLHLGGGKRAPMTIHPEAFRLYYEGRRMWSLRPAPEPVERARVLFEQALAQDANFGRAYAGLADTTGGENLGYFGARNSPEAAVRRQWTEKAIALEPTSAEVHTSHGRRLWDTWRIPEAEGALRHALQLNPNHAEARLYLAQLLHGDGRIEQALVEMEKAMEFDPLTSRIFDNYASMLIDIGRHEAALRAAERAEMLQPKSLPAQRAALLALSGLGRHDEALTLARSSAHATHFVAGAALARAGRRREAQEWLKSYRGHSVGRTVVLLMLDERDAALDGIPIDAVTMTAIGRWLYWPELDPVRHDPRFVRVLEELGMKEAHDRAQAWRAAQRRKEAAEK